MLRNYVKITFRTLARNKVYAAINVLGLSIGLTAAMLIILYTRDEVSYDRFHAGHPDLYRITYQSFTPAGGREYETGITGYLQGPRFAEGVPEIRAYVRFRQHQNDVRRGTQIESQEVFLTDPDFFSVFTFPLRSGNPATALAQPRSVVISERMAERHFGTAEALGKTIFFRDSFGDGSRFEPYAVTGVARNCPQNSSIKFDVLLPLVVKKEEAGQPEAYAGAPLGLAGALQRDFPEVEKVVTISNNWGYLVGVNAPGGTRTLFKESIAFADNALFSLFDYRWLTGNPRTALTEPNTILLTESYARKYFGQGQGDGYQAAGAVGQTLRLNNGVDVKVTGILKDPPANTDFNFGLLASFGTLKNLRSDLDVNTWGGWSDNDHTSTRARQTPVAWMSWKPATARVRPVPPPKETPIRRAARAASAARAG